MDKSVILEQRLYYNRLLSTNRIDIDLLNIRKTVEQEKLTGDELCCRFPNTNRDFLMKINLDNISKIIPYYIPVPYTEGEIISIPFLKKEEQLNDYELTFRINSFDGLALIRNPVRLEKNEKIRVYWKTNMPSLEIKEPIYNDDIIRTGIGYQVLDNNKQTRFQYVEGNSFIFKTMKSVK